MLKKILCVMLAAATSLTLCFCSSKEVEKQEDKNTENQVQETEKKEDEKSFYDIELNIKPLEEVEGETLSESAASLGFVNEKFFHAFANALGKKPSEVTAEDVEKVHYIALGTEEDKSYSMYIGFVDYVDLCLSDKREDPDFATMLSNALKMSEFVYDRENDSLADLSKFINMESFEIYDVRIDDVSFLNNYKNLIYGFFNGNGITDLSPLADYNPASLIELDFTGNEIDDFSYVEHIKDKVTVFYDIASEFKITLTEFLEQQNNPENIPENKVDETEEDETTEDDTGLVIFDENGNKTDFGALFD